MLARVISGAVLGLSAVPVIVEVDIAAKGLPSFTIVGLPDKAVEESKDRVRAAVVNSGLDFPARRITVNLAPADLPKAGPQYDLPIALGILVASGQLNPPEPSLFLGELSLEGTLSHTNGILPIAELAAKQCIPAVYIPTADDGEAAIISGITVYPVASLRDLFLHLSGEHKISPAVFDRKSLDYAGADGDFSISDVYGQEQAKRAFEIAACGGHNIYLYGPPGAGKTMLARALPSVLPRMTESEAIEVTKIYSVTGNLTPGVSMVRTRPFRAPHHTISRVGMVGGGTHLVPGEVTLAHRGVLFLDEFPEFPRHVIESLRQPMEDGRVQISRAAGTVVYPAKFIMVAAANPCPCGNFGSATRRCTCAPGSIHRYRKKISGPILDRIDLHIEIPSVPLAKLTGRSNGSDESTEAVRERIEVGRGLQLTRFRSTGIVANAEMTTKMVKDICPLAGETERFLQRAADRLQLSARSYFRVIKIARTIADLAGAADVESAHVAEALQYRRQGRYDPAP